MSIGAILKESFGVEEGEREEEEVELQGRVGQYSSGHEVRILHSSTMPSSGVSSRHRRWWTR